MAGLLAKPGDERLTNQVNALERLLKGVLAKVESPVQLHKRLELCLQHVGLIPYRHRCKMGTPCGHWEMSSL